MSKKKKPLTEAQHLYYLENDDSDIPLLSDDDDQGWSEKYNDDDEDIFEMLDARHEEESIGLADVQAETEILFEVVEEEVIPDILKQEIEDSMIPRFNKNIGFHIPRKDQCWCHNFEQLPEEEKLLGLEKYNLHIKRKNAANKEKSDDAIKAKTDRTYCSANFDLEAVLFHAKPLFYNRKLANSNFTVYSVSEKQGYCYFWTEHDAKRGSIEISSCLARFIEQLPPHVKHVSLFSDCCSGQNRNSIVACMLQQAVIQSENLDIIDLKFLEPGHTHMECDSMHATIETASEYAKLYIPNDWYNVISLAKKSSKSYKVNVMHLDDFLDYKSLKDKVMPNTNKSEDGSVLNWKEVKWIRFKKVTPNLMFYKMEFWDAEFHTVHTTKRRGRYEVSLESCLGPKAYGGFIPLDRKKYDNIMSMCNGTPPLISTTYHNYFKSLPYEGEKNQDDSDSDTSLAVVRASLLKRKRN